MQYKNIVRLIPLMLIFLYACQAKKDTTEITMKWKNNQPYSYSNIADVQTEMSIMGSKQSIEVETEMYSTMRLLQTDGKQHTIKLTYDSIHSVTSNPQINTEVLETTNDMNFIKGQSVTLHLREGKVVHVENADSLWMPLKDSVQQTIIKELYSPENLNGSLSTYFHFYPNKPVSIGESWTNKLSMKISSLKISLTFVYKLQSVKDGIAEISFTATSDDKGKMEMNGIEIPVTFKGEQTGTYLVKLEDGVLQSGTAVSNFDMSIQMAGMELPMKMTAKNEVKIR